MHADRRRAARTPAVPTRSGRRPSTLRRRCGPRTRHRRAHAEGRVPTTTPPADGSEVGDGGGLEVARLARWSRRCIEYHRGPPVMPPVARPRREDASFRGQHAALDARRMPDGNPGAVPRPRYKAPRRCPRRSPRRHRSLPAPSRCGRHRRSERRESPCPDRSSPRLLGQFPHCEPAAAAVGRDERTAVVTAVGSGIGVQRLRCGPRTAVVLRARHRDIVILAACASDHRTQPACRAGPSRCAARHPSPRRQHRCGSAPAGGLQLGRRPTSVRCGCPSPSSHPVGTRVRPPCGKPPAAPSVVSPATDPRRDRRPC